MRLLIVGGSGFIGRNLTEELGGGGYPFSGVTATFSEDASFPRFADSMGVEPVQYNMMDRDRSWDKYDVCVYVAGNADHGLAVQDPVTDLALNAQGILRLLRSFRGYLVYVSSAAVYYDRKGYVSAETPVTPRFSYGVSKLAGEHYVQAFHRTGSFDSYAIVRLFYAYGKYDKPRRLIPQVVKAVLWDRKDEFCVRGSGQSFLDPLDARYVARVLARAALRRGLNGTFDLCGGHNQTVMEVVQTVARALGREIKVSAEGLPEFFPVEFYSSLDSLRAALDLEAPSSLEEGVRSYADWALRHGGQLEWPRG